MTYSKCIDELASMDLPEGHAPEVLCAHPVFSPLPCVGEADCRWCRTRCPIGPVEDIAAAFTIGQWSRRLKDAERLLAAAKSAGYVVVPAKPNNAMIDAATASHAMITPGMAHDAIRAALDAAAGYDIVPREK